ncbi:MAG TPA: TetR/AcrR family transcriptional regulator [Gammaproteobacteria bacterium]|nr:TetR/AcrR family transcriptional regulator [Gammaproteobacteria bacterium]
MVTTMADIRLLRSVAERGTTAPERSQLQRFDWLQKALEIFVDEGIDAIRITRLADDLGVTRGSFYWHFQNREDLLDSLVSYWKDKNTAAITESMAQASSLANGIFRFFETCIDAVLFDPRLDLALREWARRSPAIHALVDDEDAARIEALRQFYLRFDYSMPQALIRARVLYYSQIGFYALGTSESLQTRLQYTDAYFEAFTGQQLTRQESENFRQYILDKYGEN